MQATNITAPNQLQFIFLRTIDNDLCGYIFNNFNPTTITNEMICTLRGPNFATCNGDSGGPLVGDGQLIGAVSFGIPCGNSIPDVFTRISFFHDWITATMAT